MKKTLYILTFLLFVTTTYSQKEYHNWYFGDSAGVTFNTPDEEPIFLDGNLSISQEGTSIVSDSAGNLKFYSVDNCLYNNNRKILCDDDKVPGQSYWTQGTVLLTIEENKFILIGIRRYGDVRFTIFSEDKTKDGITIHKNKRILKDYRGENLLVIRDFNSNSFYLILHDRSRDIYLLYKFNMRYLEFEEISKTKSNFNLKKLGDRQGYLKSSLDGRYLASFIYEEGIELLEFKNEIIKVIKGFEDPNIKFYSGEFSPNGKYLFFNTGDYSRKDTSIKFISGFRTNNFKINQINIDSYPRQYGSFLLGPNKKIYMTTIGNNSRGLYTIGQPDSINNIQFRGAVGFKSYTNWGHTSLPNIPTTYYNLLNAPDTITVCEGESIQFTSELIAPFKDTIYSWTGPNDFTSNLPNPKIARAKLSDEGNYTLTVFNGDSSVSYQSKSYVRVLPVTTPNIKVVPDTMVCEVDKAELSVPLDYNDFEWTTGETTHTITVVESGVYGVTYTNENGCTGYAEVNITFEDDMTTDILGETEICEGSSTTLSADGYFRYYLWSTGETSRTIEVDIPDKYWLEVTTKAGCKIRDTIEVVLHDRVNAELKPVPTTICEGDSVLLESKYDAPYFDYLWSTDAKTKSIYASETGTYKLTITDTRTGCMDSTEIAISVEDNLQPTIIGTNICEGETATLEALPNDPSYNYEWSNGETTPTIVVSQPATYTVIVSKDGCSGTAEFTVNESPNPEFEILGEDIVCGNTAILSPDKDFAEYLWSTDEVSKEIEVTEPGTYSLTVTDANGCSSTQEYTVNEQSLSFEISKDRIDFGKVYISETRIDSVEIVNRSGIELTITDGTQNYIIPDGFPVEYIKTLEPTELGPYTDSFEYRVISPCDTVITIPVAAEVYARVEISTKEETETKIGDEVSIPVYLECKADLSEQTYTITTDIDKTVLLTEDDYTFTQTAPINRAKTKIHEISGMIMLASELEYDITFPSYEFNNPYIEVSTEQGTIVIDSVCAFPLRNVTFLESTEMKVSPNPARDRLVVVVSTGHFDTASDTEPVEVGDDKTIGRFDRLSDQRGQRMQLELISAEGRVAYTENWTQTASEKQISINTDKIPSGLYQVRLQTPSGVLTENVIVVR